MILISVGASEYQFDRLFEMLDDLCDEGVVDGQDVIAQMGYTTYAPRNFNGFTLIGREEYQEYLEQADLIITHAGTGSVIPPLKLGKKVIVVPRREYAKEHLDDHQLELSEVFTANGYTLCANNLDELRAALQEVDSFNPKKFCSNTKNMNKLVIDYIENL